jgi:hypothetical protein
MQALIELLAGFIAMLAAAALAQFGVDLTWVKPDREIHRVSDCRGPATPAFVSVKPADDC